jgi:hypothetical protein
MMGSSWFGSKVTVIEGVHAKPTKKRKPINRVIKGMDLIG